MVWETVKDIGSKVWEFTRNNPGAVAGGIAGLTGLLDNKQPKVGYQGGIPRYTAVREQIPYEHLAGEGDRRPGAAGRRYFTDMVYAQRPSNAGIPTLEQAQAQVAAQKQALMNQESFRPPTYTSPHTPTMPEPEPDPEPTGGTTGETTGGVSAENPGWSMSSPVFNNQTGGYDTNGIVWVGQGEPTEEDMQWARQYFGETVKFGDTYAQGGLASLNKPQGFYLGGPTDGMADNVPTTIEGREPAALSDGEFVMPADVVSHLGNGNSNAGAEVLYDMMEKIRKARTGNPQQGRQINPQAFMPNGG